MYEEPPPEQSAAHEMHYLWALGHLDREVMLGKRVLMEK